MKLKGVICNVARVSSHLPLRTELPALSGLLPTPANSHPHEYGISAGGSVLMHIGHRWMLPGGSPLPPAPGHDESGTGRFDQRNVGDPWSSKSTFTGTCPTSLQDSSWIPFRNHCYTFHLEKKATPKDTAKFCQKAHGAEMLAILDETENVFIRGHLQTYENDIKGAWLSLMNSKKGKFVLAPDNKTTNWKLNILDHCGRISHIQQKKPVGHNACHSQTYCRCRCTLEQLAVSEQISDKNKPEARCFRRLALQSYGSIIFYL
uniref:uncharacterized protein n=1 Tax=Pristiophorus japonicus TaxID=55135 RepID=UPI00398F6BAC